VLITEAKHILIKCLSHKFIKTNKRKQPKHTKSHKCTKLVQTSILPLSDLSRITKTSSAMILSTAKITRLTNIFSALTWFQKTRKILTLSSNLIRTIINSKILLLKTLLEMPAHALLIKNLDTRFILF
jgi:hypothetical protein